MKYPEQESVTVEFKVTLPKNDQIIKTIIGFCNQNGGKLIIGVANNGQIAGVPEEEVERVLEYLEKSIYESSNPPIIPQIYAQTLGGKTILIIEVSAGMNKPYFVKSEGLDKGVYVRIGRSTTRATQDMIEELKWQSRGKTYDTMPLYHAHIDDLDAKTIEKFVAHKRATSAYDAMLHSYYLVAQEHAHKYPTVAGILTFGKTPQQFLSQAFIICTHFAGVSGRTVLATQDCVGTLFDQFSQAYTFITNRLNKSFVIKKILREEKLEIPEQALREIVINAIVHRNYHIQAPTKIAIYEDRIEIFSPGSFPGPLVAQNLLAGLTYIRNIALAKILRKAGMIESLGSGFRTLFESYAQYHLPEPQVIEGENYVKCILPRPTSDHRKTRKSIKPTKKSKTGVVNDHFASQVLQLLAVTPEITMADIVAHTKTARATAGRKIAEMVAKKTIKRLGHQRTAYYIKTSHS